jgi:hypothetical protein
LVLPDVRSGEALAMYARSRRGVVVAVECDTCFVRSENPVRAATDGLARAFYFSALMGRRRVAIGRASPPAPRCACCGRSLALDEGDVPPARRGE